MTSLSTKVKVNLLSSGEFYVSKLKELILY